MNDEETESLLEILSEISGKLSRIATAIEKITEVNGL